jgi:hypothetical protein
MNKNCGNSWQSWCLKSDLHDLFKQETCMVVLIVF